MKINARTLQLLPWLALVPAVGAVVLLLVAGPGARFGLWHFRISFDLMKWAAWLGIAAAALAVIAGGLRLSQRRPIFWCLTALVLGAVAFVVPWRQLQAARSVPPIHDITTDTEHPPDFVAVLERRGKDANPAQYEGAALAAQQRSAYPDLAPLLVAQASPQAWSSALAAAKDMGWEIVAADAGQGRIEATDTTFWFGFKDDVVIRVTATDAAHSRIDVRSLSRVGKSDVGANAQRIRRYLAKLKG
jgi:uncharacterized protein (DUF1499 family)